MTWHNLPCPPTIPALLAACPHGFAELTVAHHAGNPTADPPQDADTSVEIDRLWGVDMPDIGLIEGLATAIVGGDVDMPRSDCTLLVRVDHGQEVCSECGRAKADDDKDWRCDPREEPVWCHGVFVTPIKVSANWGPDGAAVYFEGEGPPKYEPADAHQQRIEDGLAGEAAAGRWNPEPPPQPGCGDMWQRVIDRYEDNNPSRRVWDIFRKRREMGIAKYGTPLQAGNGRNPLRDIMDETLDRIVYIEQAIAEQPGRAASLRTEQDNDVELVEVLLGMQGFEDSGEQCRAAYLRSIGATDPMQAAATAATTEPPTRAGELVHVDAACPGCGKYNSREDDGVSFSCSVCGETY